MKYLTEHISAVENIQMRSRKIFTPIHHGRNDKKISEAKVHVKDS
jgi:hypothetical protein